MQQRELNELFRVGRRYLLIGILVLVVCLFGSQMARTFGYRTDGERYCRKSDFGWLGRKLETNRNVSLRLVAV